jgi:hypothetical protein
MAQESNPTDPTAVVPPPAEADPATPGAPPPADPPAYASSPPAGSPVYAAPPPAGPPGPAALTSPVPGRTSAPVGWVIAAMLLFWPTGIPALLASHRAARAFGAGATDAALHESANARRWSIISVIVGGVLIVVSLLSAIAWAVLVAAVVHDREDGRWDGGPAFGNERPFGPPDGSGRQRFDG